MAYGLSSARKSSAKKEDRVCAKWFDLRFL